MFGAYGSMRGLSRGLVNTGLSVWVVGFIVVFLNWLFRVMDWQLHLLDVSGRDVFKWCGSIGLAFVVIGIGVEVLRRIWKV